MKILILSNNFFPDVGGIETNSEILSTTFTKFGHQIHLATWTSYDGINSFSFKVIRNPSFQELLNEHKWADVILENNPCLKLAWVNLLFNKPSVVVLNTWISRINGKIAIQDKLKLLWLKRANNVIAVSQAVQASCFPQALVIGNPYRAEMFTIAADSTRNLDFVFLGRLVSDKGADLAIRALSEINKLRQAESNRRAFTLTIIGDGPELQYLQQLTLRSNLQNVVTFKGTMTGRKLNEELNRHKYMIVPSVWKEPFGSVALEGLASGCIPIVADGGGLPDAVGRAGVMFKRSNLNSLVLAIRELVGNSKMEVELRSRAHEHLKNHLPEVVSKKYLDILHQACKCTLSGKIEPKFDG